VSMALSRYFLVGLLGHGVATMRTDGQHLRSAASLESFEIGSFTVGIS
jgi:hypothetical protein